MRAQSLMETSPVDLSPPCTVGSHLVSRPLVGLRWHTTLPTHAFYCKDSCSALISAAAEPSIWMQSSDNPFSSVLILLVYIQPIGDFSIHICISSDLKYKLKFLLKIYSYEVLWIDEL